MKEKFEQLPDEDLISISSYLHNIYLNLLKGLGMRKLELFSRTLKTDWETDFPKVKYVHNLKRDILNRLITINRKIIEIEEDLLYNCYKVMVKRIAKKSETISVKDIPEWFKAIHLQEGIKQKQKKIEW